MFSQFNDCTVDLLFSFKLKLMYRQSEMVACSQRTSGDNDSLRPSKPADFPNATASSLGCFLRSLPSLHHSFHKITSSLFKTNKFVPQWMLPFLGEFAAARQISASVLFPVSLFSDAVPVKYFNKCQSYSPHIFTVFIINF